jgi:prevent-host-death family protein
MATTAVIPSRDLRNRTAEILRRVEAGEEIEVLHHNRRVARLVPVRERRRWIPAAEVAQQLAALGPDSTGLRDELRGLLTDTTDDLRW